MPAPSLLRSVGVLLVSALGLACGEGEGRISIALTDAPSDDVLAAVVTIERIYLQGDGVAGRVVLRDTPVTTDLLELADDTLLLVKEKAIPKGRYDQLRFVVSGAYIEVAREDGVHSYATPGYGGVPPSSPRDGVLSMPSFSTSGLKVQLPDGGLRIEDASRFIVVDFDVAESFGHAAGASNRWVMHPVLRATDVEVTMNIVLALHPANRLAAEEVSSVLLEAVAVLTDRDGNVEGKEPLEVRRLALGLGSEYVADFRFRDPREAPFTLFLSAPEGFTIETDPSLPVTIQADPGRTTEIDAVIVAVRENR